MYQRLNRSSPSLSGSMPLQAPTYHNRGPFEVSTASHSRSTSGPPASPTENPEDVDTSTRPRLTPEQVTQLEEEFSKLPKPNTDFKKNLADRIGLTLARVNVSSWPSAHRSSTNGVQQNWYQNRRAKSKNGMKTTEAQFEVRSDDFHNPWAAFDTSFQDFVNMSYLEPTNPQLLSPDAEDDRGAASYFLGDEANCHYTTRPSTLQAQDPMRMAFNSADFAGLPFSMETTNSTAHLKTSVPGPADLDLDNYSPDNVAGIAMPEEMPVEQHFQPMYQIAGNGISMGNLSSQTFMSATSSSDGEPSLMTPPDRPSPISLRPQNSFDRRGSITRGLTTDFHTFHLQSQKSNQALYNEASNTASGRVSPAAPTTPWIDSSPPPAVSQEQTRSSLSSRIDLAARRKRPRPAPLIRPDAAQRSLSYGGPLTSSPRSRKVLLDPSHPVRRVRSGLDVVHGRIQKPSSTSAQLSPRVFENRFQAAFPNNQSPSRCNSSAYQQAPLTPLSAAQTGGCSTDFPIHHSDDGIAQHGSSSNFEGSFDFNSPPITPYHLEQFPIQHAQGAYQSHTSAMHEPPQSAPSLKTSFFSRDSPPIPSTNLPHLSWQLPAEVPSNSFQTQSSVVVAQPQYNGMTGQFEQPQIPFAYQPSDFQHPPQIQIPFHGPSPHAFQGSPEHLYAAQPQYPIQHYQSPPLGPFQHTMFEHQAAPQPLEIKVELGPPPQGTPQPRKQYTFSNSTPDDFTSPKDEAQR